MKPGKTGIARIIDAAGYSAKGLRFAWKHEAAFRQELILTGFFLIAAFFLSDTVLESMILIIPVFIVLITELLNSAIEAVVDRIGAERHDLSGAAKDIGSAAVLISLILVAVVWGLFILDKFFF